VTSRASWTLPEAEPSTLEDATEASRRIRPTAPRSESRRSLRRPRPCLAANSAGRCGGRGRLRNRTTDPRRAYGPGRATRACLRPTVRLYGARARRPERPARTARTMPAEGRPGPGAAHPRPRAAPTTSARPATAAQHADLAPTMAAQRTAARIGEPARTAHPTCLASTGLLAVSDRRLAAAIPSSAPVASRVRPAVNPAWWRPVARSSTAVRRLPRSSRDVAPGRAARPSHPMAHRASPPPTGRS
jgi:hypothetical protein